MLGKRISGTYLLLELVQGHVEVQDGGSDALDGGQVLPVQKSFVDGGVAVAADLGRGVPARNRPLLEIFKAVFVTFYFARNFIEIFQELKTANKTIVGN